MPTFGDKISAFIRASGPFVAVPLPMDATRQALAPSYQAALHSLFTTQDLPLAEARFREIIRANENDIVPYALLGMTLMLAQRWAEAVDAFQQGASVWRPFVDAVATSRLSHRDADEKLATKYYLQSAAHYLPNALSRLNRIIEGAQVHLASLAAGYPFAWFSPQWGVKSTLAAGRPEVAAAALSDDRQRYAASFGSEQSLTTCQPIFASTGEVILRGRVSGDLAAAPPVFEIWQVENGARTNVRTVQASRIAHPSANYSFWVERVQNLPPDSECVYRLSATRAGGGDEDGYTFIVPQRAIASALTGDAYPIGNTGAILAGVVASVSAGARYRFEYGERADALDRNTPWRDVPPPVNARVRDVAYRQAGHWTPRATALGWATCDGRAPLPIEAAERPALDFTGPFALDRNQTNGIGSHDLPLIFDWGKQRTHDPKYKDGSMTFSVDGGSIDLRDAELSFTLQGQSIELRGTVANIWVCTFGDDDTFWSEWALTGDPIPDSALEDGMWHHVTLKLTNDPALWTYGGTNPEDGERAARHRRLPLNDTLVSNGPFVFDFALGAERNPVRGGFRLFDVQATYRSRSALTQAAGATLVAWPPSGVSDPLHVTGGARGFDESLWTSDTAPAFPLEFGWTLAKPVQVTHLQINQHPYWPAREVEVWATDEDGTDTLLWAGTLPEGRADRRQAPYYRAVVEKKIRAASVRLRILSGYHTERCGIDGFEVFADGVSFTGDGQPCSVSDEVADLLPGQTVSYRTVLENGGNIVAGETKCIQIPATSAPLLISATPLKRANNPAVIVVRANAMGLDTQVWAEVEATDRPPEAGPAVYIGSQPTARHVYYVTSSLPSVAGRLRLRARNAAGETELCIAWPPTYDGSN
jgi:hypothetical protein